MKAKFFLGISLLFLGASLLGAQPNRPPLKAEQYQPDAQSQWAIVALSSGNLRTAPDYESGLDTQLLRGALVQIDGSDRYWDHVKAFEPAYAGWINHLALVPLAAEEVDAYIAAPKYICTALVTYVRALPSAGSPTVCDMVLGDLVRQVPSTPASAHSGWTQILLPTGECGWVPSTDVADFAAWAHSRRPTADSVIATARRLLGIPYVWGGTTAKGVDCSGLTRSSYLMNGVLLPRDAREQALVGAPVGLDEEWLPGDLLFFGTPATANSPMKIGHVALYLGDRRIIHSSQLVRINSLDPDAPDFYDREVLCVRRILGHIDTGEGVVTTGRSPWYFKQ